MSRTRLTWVLTVSSLDDEPRGDLGVGQALGDQPQHLGLARRERGQRAEAARRGGRSRANSLDQPAGDARGEQRVAGGDDADGVEQPLGGRRP